MVRRFVGIPSGAEMDNSSVESQWLHRIGRWQETRLQTKKKSLTKTCQVMWDQNKTSMMFNPPKVLLSSALRLLHICLISSFKSSNCRSAILGRKAPPRMPRTTRMTWHFLGSRNPNLNLDLPQLHLGYWVSHGVHQNFGTPPKKQCTTDYLAPATPGQAVFASPIWVARAPATIRLAHGQKPR